MWLEGLFLVWFLVLGGIYVALESPGDLPRRAKDRSARTSRPSDS